MWPLVMYSNCLEVVSTVTFPDSRTGIISSKFLVETVILYHYTLYIRIIQGIIFAAPGF